jgi:acyl-CoA reductase-like NAD-dependent aldehyde dehydrogenase
MQKTYYQAMLVRDPNDPYSDMSPLMSSNFSEPIEGDNYDEVLKIACKEYVAKRQRRKSLKQWWPLVIMKVVQTPTVVTEEMMKSNAD